MTLTPELILALVQFGTKFGLDAALAIAQLFKGGKTIDDAIAALELAKTKTYEQYIAEAKAAAAAAVATPPPAP